MTDTPQLRAAIFDLDGVITDTARLHSYAWKRLIDGYLERRARERGESHEPFDPHLDYRRYVDGKPRYQGLASFLSARGIELPYGTPDDEAGVETVCGLANRKQELFERVLAEEDVDRIEGTIRLIERLLERGVRVAVASSSRNCRQIVEAAGIAHLFEARVDGETLREMGLAGKPDPDMFVEAARRLDTEPAESVVFEDAVAGVEAGRGGRFGLVVGVAADEAARLPLRHGGADLIVEVGRMGEVTVETLEAWFRGTEHRRPSAIAHWTDLAREIGSRRPALFLDYDGTLTPIVSRPDEAVLSEEMRDVLRRVSARLPTTIVSGRGLADVAALVALDNLNYAGSHGFEISGPAGGEGRIEHEVASEVVPVVEETAERLRRELGGIEGVVVEPKRYTLAVHYRLVAPDEVPRVDAVVDAVLADRPELRKSHGKKVIDIRPALDWDKGAAVLWLLEALGLDEGGHAPIYVGDDTTDEDAFRVLESRGVGIVVTDVPRPTRARYSLQDTLEVRALLERLAEP